MMSSKLSKTSIVLICVGLCLVQLVNIFDQYFEYNVNTNIVIRYPTNDNPPAITVCFKPTRYKYKSKMMLFDMFNSTPLETEIFRKIRIYTKVLKGLSIQFKIGQYTIDYLEPPFKLIALSIGRLDMLTKPIVLQVVLMQSY